MLSHVPVHQVVFTLVNERTLPSLREATPEALALISCEETMPVIKDAIFLLVLTVLVRDSPAEVL